MRPDHRADLARLRAAAISIAASFERDGAYPDREGRVTSEAQSYAMLRAAWSGDAAAFGRAWRWTRDNLLGEGGLPAWLWQAGAVVDGGSAADADTDIALALLMAGRRWQAPALIEAGVAMARAIWTHEVAEVGGRHYLTAGPWAAQPDQLVLNPSYFAPYAYGVFHAADPERPWGALRDAGYELIARLSAEPLAGERPAGLPPDWVALRRSGGRLVPAQLGPRDTTLYSYDAPRLYWRVAVDLAWSADPRALSYLSESRFLQVAVRAGGPAASYTRDGEVENAGQSIVGAAGAFAALSAYDLPLAERLYAERVAVAAQSEGGLLWWGDRTDLYTQEWAWFMVALHAGALADLWFG